jgi:hypothetical protein
MINGCCVGFVGQKRGKTVPSFIKQRWNKDGIFLPPFLSNKPGTVDNCFLNNCRRNNKLKPLKGAAEKDNIVSLFKNKQTNFQIKAEINLRYTDHSPADQSPNDCKTIMFEKPTYFLLAEYR